MSTLIDTTQMYLRTIYELVEEGVPPLRARIAERLQQSGPTVSETVARMERDGMLRMLTDRQIVLTTKGEGLAAQVMRRHRLVECLLTQIIGLDWSLLHEEACRWEHVISTEVEERLVRILKQPTHSPYGNPIPALGELGMDKTSDQSARKVLPLSAIPEDGQAHNVMIERLGETLQYPAILTQLAQLEAFPGRDVTVFATEAAFVIATQLGEMQFLPDLADSIFVVVG